MERSQDCNWEGPSHGHLHRKGHKANPKHAQRRHKVRQTGLIAKLLQQDPLPRDVPPLLHANNDERLRRIPRLIFHPLLQILPTALLNNPNKHASEPRLRQAILQVPDRPRPQHDNADVPEQQYLGGAGQDLVYT